MQGDLISIIVPIYRVESFLDECITSILNQTYRNIEIILVDDGSPDTCPAMCDRFVRQDSRVKVIHKEKNKGLVSARKTGIVAASGQYIGYVDGDDWIEPDMYEKMHDLIRKHDADVVATGHFRNVGENYTIVKNGLPSGVYRERNLLETVYSKLIYTGEFYQYGIRVNLWNKLFKRDILQLNQLAVSDEISYGEDIACVLPILLAAKCIVVENSPYYHYRQRPASITKKYETDEKAKLKILFRYLYQYVCDSVAPKVLLSQLHCFEFYKILYRCPEIFWTENSLIPYDCVTRDSRIILYGAGDFGRILYSAIISSGFCKIELWVDRLAEAYMVQGLPVHHVESVQAKDYDYVVMAVMNLPHSAQEETREMLIHYKVAPEKIVWINDKYTKNPELLIRDIILETEK
ncbi:glycosyltransferase family 2 protein [Sporomusa sp. GT1]|uniref:glycosyltransferase family 2 protein n=1 Tax=Sporomusa sp. GT1 TaxID=1534747 RepID=UPI001665B865|nr:glycosyltransferase family 2 protein [Sporomusa sp. GT1]